MRLDILLEPPGDGADSVLSEWVAASGLRVGEDGLVEIVSDRCLDLLAELRSRCYGRGLNVSSKIFGKED